MTHIYSVTGMTCAGCKAKVKQLLEKVENVQQVDIDLEKAEAAITMRTHIATPTLQAALKAYPKYQLSEKQVQMAPSHHLQQPGEEVAWFVTYKPILLIAAYLLIITTGIQWAAGSFNGMQWMAHFMGGFFLIFSFFKMLDLRGFADSYATYDVIARKWHGWGYVYAFIELGLGLCYLLGIHPLATGLITFIVMGISIVGVWQSVLNKRKIKCACLGAVFNLPMSTVTIIEDALMIVMSAWMIIRLWV